VLGPEVIDPGWGLDYEDVGVGDFPPQSGLLERLLDGAWMLVQHDAEAVPGHRSDAEHVVVVGVP
jgi:hypothetical protein